MYSENGGSYVLSDTLVVYFSPSIFQAMVQVKGILLFRKFLHLKMVMYFSQLHASGLNTFIGEHT